MRRQLQIRFVWFVAFICALCAHSSVAFAGAPTPADLVSCPASSDLEVASSEAVIMNFLNQNQSSHGNYRVQGWRWHTMSLIRDTKRFAGLASRLLAQSGSLSNTELPLEKAAFHVVDFNMKALHRIENDLFFPWLRKKLTSTGDSTLNNAFSTLLDKVIAEQREVSKLGQELKRQAERACIPDLSESQRIEVISRAANLSNKISSHVQANFEREDAFLVPAVAILVPDSEQKSFNNKVIRNLGILDSRLHLVGMYEAVQEQDDTEQQLFRREIPSIPQYMIPRWKRNLYDPQAGFLDARRV